MSQYLYKRNRIFKYNFKLNNKMKNNLELVISLISEIKETNKNIKEAKEKKIQYYKDNFSQLNSYEPEFIKKHDFKGEILNTALTIKKLNYFEKYKYKLIDKLERHEYSPEQNKLYFRGGKNFIQVPNKTNIQDAITFIVNYRSIEQIKSI